MEWHLGRRNLLDDTVAGKITESKEERERISFLRSSRNNESRKRTYL